MYFVYILVCLQSGHSYAGHTDDLVRRYYRHRAGSTRTTREKLVEPVVAHWEACGTRAQAMRRERYFKAGSGHRLEHELIAQALKLFATSR
jgi:predicted GIY-YIG superfamily endonuclease